MNYPDPMEYGWWIASRSSGAVALVAISLSVLIGLMMANGLPRKPGMKAKLVKFHEAASLIGLTAIAVHALTLMGDQWLKPSFLELVVPLQMSYRPLMTGIGIIAAWIAAIVGLSFYARRYIGAKRWRSLHKLSAIVWLGAVVHAIGAGTDAGQIWMQAIMLLTGLPIIVLLAMRILKKNPSPEPNPRIALKPRKQTSEPKPKLPDPGPRPPLPPGMQAWSPSSHRS